MLVLTRCPNRGDQATICIGGQVEITVLAIDGDNVRLAVTAPLPPSVTVKALPESRPQKPAPARPANRG